MPNLQNETPSQNQKTQPNVTASGAGKTVNQQGKDAGVKKPLMQDDKENKNDTCGGGTCS